MSLKYGDKVRVIKEGFYKGVVGTATGTYRRYSDEDDRTPVIEVEFDANPKHSSTFRLEELEKVE